MDKKNIDFIKKYYGDSKIRELILSQATNYSCCVGSGQSLIDRGWRFPVKETDISKIEELLNEGLDIFFPVRCKDDGCLYILWDIEYFNKEKPLWIFNRENQRKIFEWMCPSLKIVENILNSFGIKYLIDVTMSGVHIWSKIASDSPAFKKFAEEGFILPSLSEKYSAVIQDDRKRTRIVPPALGGAYNTAGKILEYFTHILIRKNKKFNPYKIPVTISDAPRYGKHHMYSGVSSDLSQYAHPVFMRCIRAFCSLHQKSIMNGCGSLGPAIDIIKIKNMSYTDILDIMWDADAAINFYKRTFKKKGLEVPESSAGWLKAVNTYIKSNLRELHKKWEKTPIVSSAPELNHPEIRKIFEPSNVNPALLIPGNLQMLAEYFTASGGISAVKKIFSVIAKDYYMNRSYGWYNPVHYTGINWDKYDAETAADFWGRVYWSLKISGLGRKCNY